MPAMGALTSLDMSKNDIGGYKSGNAAMGALAVALKANAVLQELNLASNDIVGEEAKILADGLSTNGALVKLDVSDNDMFGKADKTGITAWADVLKVNSSLTQLNLAKNKLTAKDTMIIAPAISANGALEKLNLSDNSISGVTGEPGVHALADMLRKNSTLKELNVSKNELDAECAQILSPAISAHGALETLNISHNSIFANGQSLEVRAEAATALAEALKANSTITNFNISSNYMRAEQAQIIAPAIGANGALSKLIFGGDPYYKQGERVTPEPATLEVDMTEADVSNKNLGAGGAIIVGTWISQKDNGALASLNISKNKMLGAEAGKAFAAALAANTVLTELDLSGQPETGELDAAPNIDVAFAKEFAVGLGANGALVTVNISKNMIRAAGAKHLSEAIKEHKTLTSLDVSSNEIGAYSKNNDGCSPWIPSPEGPAAIADGIKNNGALEKLLMANNGILNKESGKALADALKVNSVLKELDVSSNYRPFNDNSKDGPGFAQELAVGVGANGALTSLNMSNNNLASWVGAEGWSHGYHGDWSGNKFWKHTDGRRQDNKPGKPDVSGVIALADAIPTMGAMTSLNISNNNIPVENMNEIIAIVEAKPAMKVLCAVPFRDKTITELDVSGQRLGVEGALVIRRYLENNGALAKLTFGGDGKYYKPATLEVGMKKADFSNKNLGDGGAIIVGAWISHKDNGAMAKLDLRNNGLSDEALGQMTEVCRRKGVVLLS
jgi:Ran GTPase-activating protein (RanGAP) involved in mRNA processing and transport